MANQRLQLLRNIAYRLRCVYKSRSVRYLCRMLQCGRITIHKNLVASFIIRSVLFVVYFEPFVTDRKHSYRDIVRILCFKQQRKHG